MVLLSQQHIVQIVLNVICTQVAIHSPCHLAAPLTVFRMKLVNKQANIYGDINKRVACIIFYCLDDQSLDETTLLLVSVELLEKQFRLIINLVATTHLARVLVKKS
jgi:hypothetical protein